MMLKLLRQIISRQKGQALPVVLALLVLGGLVIVPSLGYATTVLNSSRMLGEDINGIYAADAGVEHAVWQLGRGVSPPATYQLAGNINQMGVTIDVLSKGTYTLVFGELVDPRVHSDYISVDGAMVWDAGANAYRYTITVTWQAGGQKHFLDEVGARLPVGYSYRLGSAASFGQNLSTSNPTTDTLDGAGAHLLNWVIPGQPFVSEDDPVKTQTFYVTGAGSLEGDYTWVVAQDNDIGAVGEITGAFYRITATAKRPGDNKVTARIVAEAMIGSGITSITSWQISN